MNTSTMMMPVRTLRERMAEDMDLRRSSRATQRNYRRTRRFSQEHKTR